MNDPLWQPGDPATDRTVMPTIDSAADPVDGTADTTLAGPESSQSTAEDPSEATIEEPAGPLTAEQGGRYVLRGSLGEGGLGLVDRVFDRHLRREVAFKQLKPEIAARADRARIEARLAAEARITARLAHPGIVPVHELGRRPDGALYYTMKRVAGVTLRAALDGADLPARLALLPRYVGLCQAVAYAHSQGFMHRDLKPANVMLGDFGETLVLDWGIARPIDPTGDTAPDGQTTLADEPGLGQTVDGAVLGTPQYMSPEQLAGRADDLDARTDVYALGVILYQLLTGGMPFPYRSVAALLANVPSSPAPDARAAEPDAPHELAAVARRALAPDPAERYPDAGALVDDVLAFQAGRLVTAHRYTRRERVARWLRRNRLPLGVLLALIVVGAATWIGRGRQEAERLASAEAERLQSVLDAVHDVVAEARAARTTGWLDLYSARLAGLNEPAVEDRIIGLLDDSDRAVRQLAARSLGLMSSRRAVEPLMNRLGEGVEPDEAVVVEVIRALGIIGDARAEPAVYAARKRFGSTSYVAHNTETAYRLLPPEPPPADASADTWVDYGRALVEKKRDAEGIAAYDRALALQPDLTRALNNRAIAQRRLGRFADAGADLDRALSLDPDFLPSLFNRGTVRRYRMDYAGSRSDFDRALDLARRQERESLVHASLRMRAWTAWLAGDIAASEADVEETLRLDSRNRQTLGIAARFAQAAGRPDDALSWLQRTIERDPSFPLTYQHRARVHRELGDLAAARADIEQAALLEPALVDLAADRALIAVAAGDRDSARRLLDDAVRAHPGDGALRAWRAALVYGPAGDWQRATDDLARAVRHARPAEAVAFELMHKAAARLAGRRPLPTVQPRGEIPLHDRLAALVEGQPLDGPLVATAPGARCAVAVGRWLAGRPLERPDGPPPFDPTPLCAFVEALPQ